jgi:integrase
VVGPAEEFLEFLRVQGTSPNTVKSYARALALWWSYLAAFGLAWDSLALSDVGGFLAWLRSGDGPDVVSIEPRPSRFAESTVGTRLQAVLSCYWFHEVNGVTLGRDLVRVVHGGRSAYKPMLEHVARRKGRQRQVIRVRTRRVAPPVLSPGQIEAVMDACARFDEASREWRGSIRNRLLWALLSETGLRLGEALGLQHRDWHAGCGGTPFIEVVPREHPHGVRAKGGRYRRVVISDDLDRLYGDYVWDLCDAGADMAAGDMDAEPVFVNLAGPARFGPWRPESVYDLVGRLRRTLAGTVPEAWTPHWMRHSHATALQMGRIASDASFGSWREHALPAAQRAGLRCRRPAGPSRSCGDLGFRGPSGSDATMMRLVALRCVHHRCACWPCDASGCSWLRRVHHGGSGGRFAASGSGAGVAAPGLGAVIATRR